MAEPAEPAGLDVYRSTKAVEEAHAKRARGERVWCVPFARTLSGIELRGNAETWFAVPRASTTAGQSPRWARSWCSAARASCHGACGGGVADRVGREILIDHANWKRNQISLKMSVIDISDANDWSLVKVAYDPGQFGRPYPISGFVYPRKIEEPVQVASNAF